MAPRTCCVTIYMQCAILEKYSKLYRILTRFFAYLPEYYSNKGQIIRFYKNYKEFRKKCPAFFVQKGENKKVTREGQIL